MKKVLGLVVVVAAVAAGAWYVTRSPEGQKAATEAVTDAEQAAKAVTGAVEQGTSDSRITSYNVCYTKLLRLTINNIKKSYQAKKSE